MTVVQHVTPSQAGAVAQIKLANPRGFCAGVEMAIKALAWMVRLFPAPVYCYHEIVHNRHVCDQLRAAGAVFVDQLVDVPDDGLVIFSAHGVAPSVRDEAASRGLKVIDATGIDYERTDYDLGAHRYLEDGTVLPDIPPRPAFARGWIELRVPPVSRTLDVVIEPALDAVEPGASTDLTVTVTDPSGAAVEARIQALWALLRLGKLAPATLATAAASTSA